MSPALLGKGVSRFVFDSSGRVRAGYHFPEVPVWIREVAEIASPRSALSGLDDCCAGALGLGEHGVHTIVRSDDVREAEAPEAAAFRGNAGVIGEECPGVEPERRGAVLGGEGNEIRLVDLDGPAQALAVKQLRPTQIRNANLDTANVRVHLGVLHAYEQHVYVG